MKFPDSVNRYLRASFREERRPFCFLIDREYRLVDCWGDAAAHHFKDIAAGDFVDDYAPYLVGMLGGSVERLPFVTTSSGTVEVHVLPENGNFFVIVMDAGVEHESHRDRQQVANELRLLHASQAKLIDKQRALIGELVEAKTELDQRRQEAVQANASKSRFIAMMSHEFRTPLTSIINYADLALDDRTSVEDIHKSAEAIARASRHMQYLVETVLDEARLEAGQVKLNERAFELHELFDDVAAIMAPLAAEKGLSFGIFVASDVPRTILADDVCLRQILINLLGNAIKFTDTGSVRVDAAWRDENLHVTVTDTGPGIPAVDQERIFDAFEQAGEFDRRARPGTGLGLTISLKLARLMRGDIQLHSQSRQGCRLVVVVPATVHDSEHDDGSAMPEPAEDLRAMRPATILVCDDDEDLLALAEYYLQRAGYGLLIARDGEEAVQKALTYAPDLVLMDINVPRLTGSDAASRLRAQGFDAPIVALTASDVRKLDSENFSGSLRKPIQMPRLLAQIQTYL